MQNDRQITITTGASRRATHWQAQKLLLSELYAKLATPVRSTEAMADEAVDMVVERLEGAA